MPEAFPPLRRCAVALRKESVDRNPTLSTIPPTHAVALRKESVDRNNKAVKQLAKDNGRSPQGERG